MRYLLFLFIGILLWAGSVSINYGNRPQISAPPPPLSCSAQSAGDHLFGYLEEGTITGVRDNGQVLTVGLTPEWPTFSSDIQAATYKTVVCYAQAQQRRFEFVTTPKS